jgi:hypothetical protein
MAIRESFVPSETPRVLRAEYRVEGDSPWQSYPTREAAEEREAELTGDGNDR